jgi:hypothetical protein
VTGHQGSGAELIHIQPERVLGWGLDTDAFAAPNARATTNRHSPR